MIHEAAKYLESRLPFGPSAAVVLGSAQAAFADALQDRVLIDYKDIPHWPVPGVEGHAGQLISGRIGSKPVLVLSGRVHLYEGWPPRQVTFGVRVLGLLGVRTLVLTNAAGGINESYQRGQLVLITDHLNLQGYNPLIGPNDNTLGPRFPDMSNAYSPALRARAKQAAAKLGIALGEGVYAALLGPSFETPAEIRYLRTIGADLVGMSTVAEVIVANYMGMEVLALSTVTNLAAGMQQALSHQEVLQTGTAASSALVQLLAEILSED